MTLQRGPLTAEDYDIFGNHLWRDAAFWVWERLSLLTIAQELRDAELMVHAQELRASDFPGRHIAIAITFTGRLEDELWLGGRLPPLT